MYKTYYTYADIGLKPIKLSEVRSRSDVDTTAVLNTTTYSIPLIISPMDKVVGLELYMNAVSKKIPVILPRSLSLYQTIDYINASNINPSEAFVAVSSKPTEMHKIEHLYERGVRNFCIDVANGFHIGVKEAIQRIKDNLPWSYIITGNVASVEGYSQLTDWGADAVRVGIGNGSVCSTSVQTGVGVGQATLVREIAKYKAEHNLHSIIIADGGVKSPGDIAKAIALGADFVMTGSLFASTQEAPGAIIKHNGLLFKHYAGQASAHIKKDNYYVEGVDKLIAFTGSFNDQYRSICDGLRSSMSYMNCKDIKSFKFLDDECFVLNSMAAFRERLPHAE